MKCPYCNKRMRYDEKTREYYCSNCDQTIPENELWATFNAVKILENGWDSEDIGGI